MMFVNHALDSTTVQVDIEQYGFCVQDILQHIINIGGTITNIFRDTMYVFILYGITYEEVFLQGIPPQIRETWRVLRVTAGSEAPGPSHI